MYYIAITSIIFLFYNRKIKFLKFILGNGISQFFKKNSKKLIAIISVCIVILNIYKITPKNLRIYFVDVGQR